MGPDEQHLQARRQDVLARLRQRRGLPRREAEQGKNERSDHFGTYVGPFLRAPPVPAPEGSAAPASPGVVTDTHVHTLFENVQDMRHGGPHPLEPREAVEGAPAVPELSPEKKRELLKEIASDHFRKNMQDWMGSVHPEHELSSSPLDELKHLQEEARYRLGVLKTMQNLTEHAIDVLETHIRAAEALKKAAGDSEPSKG